MCPHDKLRLLTHFLLRACFVNIQKLRVLVLKIWVAQLEDLIFSTGKGSWHRQMCPEGIFLCCELYRVFPMEEPKLTGIS